MTHWTPPNKGKTSTGGPLSTGQFPTMGTDLSNVSWVRPQGGHSASRQNLSKSGGNDYGHNSHRPHRTTSAAETFGPAGVVQVRRSLHGAGCACCATTSRYRVPSAFGSQDQFRSGEATGKRG